jgi:four helix bundle protein
MALQLEDLEVYIDANIIADEIWSLVSKWDYFQKDTIGKQIVKSSDSIGANISEGYGRYFHKENLQFCYYFRGSLYETKT